MDAVEHDLTQSPAGAVGSAETDELSEVGPAAETRESAAADQRRTGGSYPWRRLAFWRSPDDQPRWARSALLAVTAVSTFCYAWRAFGAVNVEIYYAAAVRSMSMSWNNFFFGAFDPFGSVSTDKLPGALWIQALSVRLFGIHTWALMLPQVVEGALTVLVLYRAVRRLAGPGAGLMAAAILAISPATVSLDRGNISDTLMILLAVLAADAIGSAVITGRRRYVLLAGLWVGLAFQAKMIEAWLLLPALAGCFLLAAPGAWRQRAARTAALAAMSAVVSLAWMTVVTAWPASGRPYVDGSRDNSVFQQVFVYNGFGRLDQPTPDQLLDSSIRLGLPAPARPGWDRLLTGALGRDAGWLLGAALVALAIGLAARRSRPRGDRVRACLVLWGGWLIVLALVFSVSPINSYYVAALSPTVAALLGTGLSLAWRARLRGWALAGTALALALACGYAAWLLPAGGTGLPGWLRPAVIGLAVLALACLAVLALRRAGDRATAAALALCALAALIVPAVAAASVVTSRLGPFETPFEPAGVTAHEKQFFGAGFAAGATIPTMEAANRGAPYLAATQTSALAAPLIWASGKEVFPIGGFTGTIPEPSLPVLRNLVQMGDVHTFIQSPTTTDPRLLWVAKHCFAVPQPPGRSLLPLAIYFCVP